MARDAPKEKAMKGIFYSRHGRENENREEWAVLADGQQIIVRASEVWLHLPGVTIPDAEFTFHCCGCCPRRCGEEHRQACRRCSADAPVRLQVGGADFGEGTSAPEMRSVLAHYEENWGQLSHAHSLGEFAWDWSGSGATEWWFDDEAVGMACILYEYTSQSGLTAARNRLVAYKRKVKVVSFRDYGGDARPKAEPGIVAAQFANLYDAGYRANWTGFAYGVLENQNAYGEPEGRTPIIGDDLDVIIQAVLDNQPPVEKTVCRHLGAMQAYIVCRDPASLPRFLCMACRMQGVRWEEFLFANKADTCPYFLRAVKTVTQKSDALPPWYAWRGENLMGSYLRLQDGEWLAYETVFVSRREQFIRHGVLLLNSRTREAWTYRYTGFVPRTIAEFREKYGEGWQTQGYAGTGNRLRHSSGRIEYLTEQVVREAVAQRCASPLWASEDGSLALLSWEYWRDELESLAIQRGAIAGIEVVPLQSNGEEDQNPQWVVGNPRPFYADQGSEYFLLCIGQLWVGGLALRRDDAELFRTDPAGRRHGGGGAFFLLRVAKAE